MTTPLRLEQDLPMLLEDLYVSGTPDYRDDLVRRIAAMRQRPVWAFPERWLPMDIATQAVPTARMPWRQLGVLALIALLIAVTAAVYVGSRPRPPEPFGLAANGALVYAKDGDIYARDTLDAAPRPIVTGPGNDVYALHSPRGDRMAVIRSDDDGENLYIADADGSRLRHLAGPWKEANRLEFSPDGSMLAVEHSTTGIPIIELVATDGSGSRPVADIPGMYPTFRPPDGRQLLFRGQEPSDGRWWFYLVDIAGGEPVRLDVTGERIEGGGWDLLGPAWSPTGDRLAFHTLIPLPDSQGRTPGFRVSVAEVAPSGAVTGVTRLEFDAFSDDEMNPLFTPDGKQLVFMQRFGLLGVTAYTDALWIAPVDGSATARPLGVESPNGDGLSATIAPDGGSILAHRWTEGDDWLIDLDTGSATPTDLASTDGVSWQRRGD